MSTAYRNRKKALKKKGNSFDVEVKKDSRMGTSKLTMKQKVKIMAKAQKRMAKKGGQMTQLEQKILFEEREKQMKEKGLFTNPTPTEDKDE